VAIKIYPGPGLLRESIVIAGAGRVSAFTFSPPELL